VYGRKGAEVVDHDLPTLRRMLSKWPNLIVDTSGVSSRILAMVLRSIDIDRIIFGSDALYVPMWQAVAVALHAIRLSGAPLEDTFARIAQSNPSARLRME
jgi:predicted TIM-barrel fold metal-dependent hydrolase